MSARDEGGGSVRLVYWVLGALLTLVGLTSGIAHALMMRQMDIMEQRMQRIENRLIDGSKQAGYRTRER